ncbi:hypothetical protein KXD93_00115 [Mucilaginibacter sp. BJC16-A38]|uniref:DUF5723 family protein n=1 Tax=Mucilaginibacter phenanthrenivorans TaxID=1234842 RepID=UPI002156F796|nr:DUF5723 family protein [Mucilaginibacter phenanthrenivorans]MCR8556021.1 hypothetical protein [Mucilaginibacter phenanthrenivorans]
MKKILLVLLILTSTIKLFGQQFSQYNTGTLYDSFENPSQKAFITDSSKQFASNFLIPNLNVNFFITGDAQATLKSRAFSNKYDNSALVINGGKVNHVNLNAGNYDIMFKMFSSLNGDVELGFSVQTKFEGKGLFTDESISLLNGLGNFKDDNYSDIFNDNYYFQTYHQIGFSYREKINKQFSFGAKLSALMGIQYEKMDIVHSQVSFDKADDSAILGLSGIYYSNYIPGHLIPRDYLPNFRNPGAAISIGGTFRTEDGFIIQGNVKDLGFIHWSSRSHIYAFDDIQQIEGLSTPSREKNVYNSLTKIIHGNQVTSSFTTPIDGRGELSVNKMFWIDDNKNFKYSPTLIASKELFYPGFTGALVNPFQYKKYILTLTTTYDDMKLFNLGAQFMIQTPNFDFFLGSDKLTQTASLTSAQLSKSPTQTYSNGSFTGASFFLGASIKFGPVIEHPMNASTIPTGEKGFLGRLWGRIFKTND